ncbi:hypothetical protein [Shewanella colwelliana]|uniref:hypothetical protein n=1 Tax=Shewanella colwelliana TaxID=23 RepID=UPI0022AEA4F7|nr:hypothetical protein [Shewanella colwelliana]MCZ4336717.1 hypothetical protein [Shewanella colwelliana]
MKNLLYLCTNDGSDMRVCKEVRTLSQSFNIYYVGSYGDGDSFCKDMCHEYITIKGKQKSILFILKYWFTILRLFFSTRFTSIHVVEEQLYFVLLPLLFYRNVTIDIFDSIFLKLDKPKEKLWIIKKIVYGSVKNIIVTDEHRKQLLPSFAREKAHVIPNVPFSSDFEVKSKNRTSSKLTLFLFGSIAKNRGAQFVSELLDVDEDVDCVCAGWLADDFSKEFLKRPRVTYLGVTSQYEINHYLAKNDGYLVAIYPLINLNNVYASPNKIYDAIHTETPLIINKGVLVGDFVAKENIGVICDTEQNPVDIIRLLLSKKHTFTFSKEHKKFFCWENFEGILRGLHV